MFPCIMEIQDDSDREFITGVYVRYHQRMYWQAKQVARDSAATEDIVHDATVKLIGKVALLKQLPEKSLLCYVIKTIKSTALLKMRRLKVERKWTCSIEEDSVLPSDELSPEELFLKMDEIAKLGRAVSCLPEREQDMIYFRYRLELDYTELCEIFGLSPGSVRKCYTRLRRKLLALMMEDRNGQKK